MLIRSISDIEPAAAVRRRTKIMSARVWTGHSSAAWRAGRQRNVKGFALLYIWACVCVRSLGRRCLPSSLQLVRVWRDYAAFVSFRRMREPGGGRGGGGGGGDIRPPCTLSPVAQHDRRRPHSFFLLQSTAFPAAESNRRQTQRPGDRWMEFNDRSHQCSCNCNNLFLLRVYFVLSLD